MKYNMVLFVNLVVAVLVLMMRPNVGISASSSIEEQTNQRRIRHGSDESDELGDTGACRVAVCLSGAIRSFVHHAVHGSIQGNLIEAIKADGCEVDVFAYATRRGMVGQGKEVR